ncbi:Histone-lysine N-methyltransferase H3 lysine-9 specific SUVH1 [Euphorbia peplus]|nr:Histone-lysine N-methyltransferase H3 lysine-9 specific SUVH1 [Euphorbia peplus]
MEGGSNNNSAPPHNFDKTRVLDVKPLRSLMPVFPSSPQTPPFICTPPSGPFPAGFSPFFPFNGPQGTPAPDLNQRQTHASAPAPLRSFRPQQSNGDVVRSENGDGSSSQMRQKRSAARPKAVVEKKPKRDVEVMLAAADSSSFVVGITLAQREDGNRDIVNSVLMRFDSLRRKLSQLEDSRESTGMKRADLKAGNVLMSKGVRTNQKKRIGAVPGMEIGDIFFFRMEMCLVGLHSQSMAGIDCLILRGEGEEDPLAISIVSAGGYDDEAEDPDVLIYSGHGGGANSHKRDKPATDQKLERGNLALERSLHRANEVRVIRGMKDVVGPASKVYVYDGLYRIQESWVDKGKSGCNMFKYKLIRVPGQAAAFSVWKSIQQWKEGFSNRVGLILPDLTSGVESLPVSLVNDFDEEKGPAYFTYFPSVKYLKSFKLTEPSYGCTCRSACAPGDLNCSCIRKNGGDFPYTSNGLLVGRRPLVHECGPSCPCGPNCKNKVSQNGSKLRLEVFRTKDRGWGLRSWDPIRAGTFVCEYAGEVIDKVKPGGEDDEYVFDTTRLYEPFKWNCEPGLIEDDGNDIGEEYELPSPLIISAKNSGNVSRFMNHSCTPNVFWQPVAYDQNSETYVHIAFFAMKHIPPMVELTYDYGISRPDEADGDHALQGKKKCLCGSPKCRGTFG